MSSIVKRFFNDSVVYALQPLLTKTFSYFLIPLYTAYLTPADFGNLNYIMAIGNFFRSFVEMGLYTSFWKFKSKEGGYKLEEVIYNVNLTQFLIAFNILLIVFLIKQFFIHDSVLAYLVLLYLVGQTISIVFQSSSLVYRARFQAKKYLIATLSSTLLLLLLNIIFVAVFKWNFQGVIYSYIAGYSILAVFFFKISGFGQGNKVDKGLIKNAIIYGFPIMVGNIASLLITVASRFFLKEFSTDHELGLYSFGYKFGELYHLILTNTFFMAWNALRWEIYESPNGKTIFARFYDYVLIVFPLLGLLLIPILYWIANLITVDKEFLEGMQVMPLIIFSFVFQGFYYYNAMGLLFEAKTKSIMFIVVVGGVISVVLNVLLITPFGMFGAAISTFIAYFVMFVICKYLSDRAYSIRRNKKMEFFQILLVVIFTFVFTAFFIFTKNKLYLISSGIIVLLLILGIYFMSGVIKISELKLIFNQLRSKKGTTIPEDIIE